MSAPSRLGWCEHCGEGVTNFCRGKSALCPRGLRVLHRNAGVPCLTCAANHYCPEHNPDPRGADSDAALTAELHQLRMEVWRQGSRFNCVVLDKPPLPDRQFYRSNAEFLKACAEAVDAFMERSVVQGRNRAPSTEGHNPLLQLAGDRCPCERCEADKDEAEGLKP